MNTTLSKDEAGLILREYLAYSPETGHLTWIKKPSKKTNINTRAGSLVTTTGYRSISFFGRTYLEHHLIWCWVHGEWSKEQLDHIDQDRSNNRISNLREVSKAENARNRSRNKDSRVGEVGIWFNKNTRKYVAEITMTQFGVKKKVFQKAFTNIEDAIAARKAKAIELGFHENHGS